MTSEIDDLTLRFPARPGYLAISRLNAAAVGTAAGFDVEEFDDLRLAVTEVSTWLLADAAAAGDVELRLAVADGRIEIDGSRSGAGLAPNPADELVEAILGATVASRIAGRESIRSPSRLRQARVVGRHGTVVAERRW